ncbi:penicillin-binding transpeptidase domain-containing protein [Rhodococcus maanshanensis]|uniref:Penicillin binding protein transpeptidase domain-containing protein n=1 Tax=Rhodococcus maanshanensis TaxID=183556 RepID=A0A1H7TGW0_9NOCA|nr:penicillin-binding transpeptidase domain-containing protein [Rhodococcus maanshanensis]SEL83576.1 Penicillin binding protein transpeptidase domain-containing protein [Rhodococcus maanshanensis]
MKLSVAGIAVSALVLGGCTIGQSESETEIAAQQFADALTQRNAQAAADLTSDPAAAKAAISQMFDGLAARDATFVVASTDSDAGTFTLDADWTLGAEPEPEPEAESTTTPTAGTTSATPTAETDSAQTWSYTTTGGGKAVAGGGKIPWDPQLLAPGLTADTTLRYTTLAGGSPQVLDAAGRPLMSEQTVTLVNLDPATIADPAGTAAAVAQLVGPVAPTVTAASLQADLAGAQGKTVTAITLRDADFQPIADRLAAIPGVQLVKQTRLLTADKAMTSPTLDGLRELWQQGQDASAGWAVQLVSANGSAERLAGADGTPQPDIATTLDPAIQGAAQAAIADLPQQAAIVALRPSTGAVLAVAQNPAATAQGPIALTGLYPPGSTFKTVTTSAALQSGSVTPDTVLPCPGSANIEGRTIPNDDNFDLGSVPLHTAFARSCNTTMGALAVALPPTALPHAALQFGLGVDYVTPGLTTVTGSVPPADTPAQRVESAIGQGQVTATPFGMALVAASIAKGSTPAPTLVAGMPGVANTTPAPAPPQVTEQLRTMMRETVTAGTATQLADIADLRGKTGTAEVGDAAAHGWFVGIDGDVAFAVFVAGADSSAPAVDAAGRFLRPIQAQIPR